MQRLALLLVLASSLGPQDITILAPDGAASEPPQRVLVTVGDETVEVDLGGRGGVLVDGRVVAAALLPTRRFDGAGSFEFEYPQEWKFLGAAVGPDSVDAWWTLYGKGGMVYLRRHGSDAAAIVAEYASNMERAGGTGRRATVCVLDGKRLEGFAVDSEVGNFDGLPSTLTTQEIFGWQESEKVAWLIALTTDRGVVPEYTIVPIDPAQPIGAPPSATPGGARWIELERLIASFHFTR